MVEGQRDYVRENGTETTKKQCEALVGRGRGGKECRREKTGEYLMLSASGMWNRYFRSVG